MVELAVCPVWADILIVVKKDAVVSFWSFCWRWAGLTTGCELREMELWLRRRMDGSGGWAEGGSH